MVIHAINDIETQYSMKVLILMKLTVTITIMTNINKTTTAKFLGGKL